MGRWAKMGLQNERKWERWTKTASATDRRAATCVMNRLQLHPLTWVSRLILEQGPSRGWLGWVRIGWLHRRRLAGLVVLPARGGDEKFFFICTICFSSSDVRAHPPDHHTEKDTAEKTHQIAKMLNGADVFFGCKFVTKSYTQGNTVLTYFYSCMTQKLT